MTTNATHDPFDVAMKTEYVVGPLTVFGQCATDSWFCKLVTGTGKVVWDETADPIDVRRTAIKISIVPLPGSPNQHDTVREMLAESREWAEIVKPSLGAVGHNLRSVNGVYVQAELVPTGRKYTNSRGETKDATTVKFVRVFGSPDECQRAADAFFAARRGSANGNGAHSSGAHATTTPTPSQNDAERETARLFLPALWRLAGNDPVKFDEQLRANQLVARYFTIDSPEAQEVMGLDANLPF